MAVAACWTSLVAAPLSLGKFDRLVMAADNEAPMDVTLALLADHANTSENGKLNVLGMFNQVYSDSFPYQHPLMFCIVQLTAKPSEFGKKKQIEVVLLDPDGKTLGTIKGEATVPKPNVPGKRAQVEIIIRLLNVPFQSPGDYAFSILVGGDEKWSIPVTAVERKGG